MRHSRFFPLLITLLGSLLLWASWPMSSLTPLIFVSFVPLLWVENEVQSWKKFLGCALLHFFLWNALTTWWIWNASPVGSVGAFVVNSIVMSIPWLLYK